MDSGDHSAAKGTKVFDLEIDGLGGIWIRGEWGPDIKKAQGETIKELHERYGHISYDTLKTLPEYPKNAGKPPRCKACEKGNATKTPSPKSKVGPIRTKQPLERLHCDLVGPIKPATPGKQYQYLLVVTDDYTRSMSAKPLRIKDETTNALVEIVNILEKASQHPVKMSQADWEANDESRFYGPYNILLMYLFPYTEDFVVEPQYKRPEQSKSVDFTTILIVRHKEHPVFFLEIKASEHLRRISSRKDADLQMRERFENLFDDVEVETLYGISALGTKLCIYTVSKETGRLLPKRVPAGPQFVTDTAPINRWDVDIMTPDGEQ